MKKIVIILIIISHVKTNATWYGHELNFLPSAEIAARAEKRLNILKKYDEERFLEETIVKIHPTTPYKKMMPVKSYALLGVHPYACNDEIEAAYKNSKKRNLSDLQFNQAKNNIDAHREMKAFYSLLVGQIKEIDSYRGSTSSMDMFISKRDDHKFKNIESCNSALGFYIDQANKQAKHAKIKYEIRNANFIKSFFIGLFLGAGVRGSARFIAFEDDLLWV
ncbi:hypothetical protein KBC04_03295 [Candidatus Babeliales bacterium]|nr:hypothetical protein [Candidatus Babeliales bacterium]MBP9843923.1 hypothetical protein [Candidatus Babeliales bacterium]